MWDYKNVPVLIAGEDTAKQQGILNTIIKLCLTITKLKVSHKKECKDIPSLIPFRNSWSIVLQQGNGFEVLVGYAENHKLIFFYVNKNIKSLKKCWLKNYKMGETSKEYDQYERILNELHIALNHHSL